MADLELKTKISMRHLSYLTLILLISCEGKSNKTYLDFFSNLNLSIDTVIIDPGDEIIFLKHQLLNADMGKDGKYFYNFNGDDHTLEKINLDELRLEEKLPFEREGPNGTGPSGAMSVHNENQITMTGYGQTALFSMDGKKLMTVNFEDFFIGKKATKGGEQLKLDRVLDTNANRLYVIIHSYIDESYTLGILYLDAYEVNRLMLESFEKLSNYNIFFNSGGIRIFESPPVNLDKVGTKVILSNLITNTLMWYDTEMDSLFIKSYNSQLTANQKENEFENEYETPEEFEIAKRKLKQEINFMPPFWEEQGECFYRFSYQEIENTGGEIIRSKVYLTALDKDLNMLGETLIPQLTKKPGKHFAKDGEIWIYENINDEMGFVRLKMKKNN